MKGWKKMTKFKPDIFTFLLSNQNLKKIERLRICNQDISGLLKDLNKIVFPWTRKTLGRKTLSWFN